ncbi:helix-turn-helix domain-containing protein [Polyangium sp. 15x6]|uniref:helix-turn-helix domain-containing protein n=1 Tax=Polyangium sp. 15x6 TaxID=3042687 RepID=UPI002499DDAC|nr:helix-turn-helix domain-containing protein [Polyangium sp. 15x6]MDI3286105.1 helix-turn-helix domain-containing protein [Polyangium sp. 15x6]
MDLGDRVKQARQLRGIKSTELDRLAGVSQGTTSRLESKQRGKFGGTATTVQRVAKALRVNMEWLMTGQGPMEETEEDPIPNRALAASIARDGGVDEEAIRAVLGMPVKDAEARTVLWWIDAFRAREAFLAQEREITGAAPAKKPTRTRARAT